MTDLPEDLSQASERDEIARCVVRLATSMYRSSRGLHLRKDLVFLKRQCSGYNVLDEDARSVDPSYVIERVENLHECKDGVYEVVTCNEHRDWETGYVDDYDYRLEPVTQ